MIINKIANPFGKLFYLATNLNKEGRINDEEKGRLKDLIIKEDKLIMDLLNTFSWSQNLQGLENNIVDHILKKTEELEEIVVSPNRSPEGRSGSRNNSKKPSRVVVPSNRTLGFYNASNKPAAGIYVAQVPTRSMPTIELEEDEKVAGTEKDHYSPSLQVIPTFHSPDIREHKKELSLLENMKQTANNQSGLEMNQKKNEKEQEKQPLKPIEKVEEQPQPPVRNQQEDKVTQPQLIVTDVRGRSKTERLFMETKSSTLKQTQLETIQSMSREHDNSSKQLNTASLLSGRTRPSAQINQFAFESETKPHKTSSNTLKPPSIRPNHSVENTPASKIKDPSVGSWHNGPSGGNNDNGNASRRERSLSAFTDDSNEPCGFMDYYKAYKKENSIPPSEIGDRELFDNSTHLRPPVFGLGIARRNTVEVNNGTVMVFSGKNTKEIQGIEEQMDENASPQDKKKSRKTIKKEGSFDGAGKRGLFTMMQT